MGPRDSDDLDFRDLRESVYDGLSAPAASDAPLDVAGALAEIYNYMSGLNVGSNASVYLITGSAAARDLDDEMANVGPVMTLIDASGWSVFNITAPSVDPALASELNEIALDTGGRSFALTVPDGFEALTDDTLRREGKGLMTKLGDTVLSDSVFEFVANVVPGTKRLDLLFFREESLTSFRLTNPSGLGGVGRRPLVVVGGRAAERGDMGDSRPRARRVAHGSARRVRQAVRQHVHRQQVQNPAA